MGDNEVAKIEKRLPVSNRPEETFEQMISMGDSLVKTGFLPVSVKTGAQAAAIILRGRELGLGPMESLTSINVIQGKPTISPQMMLALAYKRVPGFSAECISASDKEVIWEFKRPGSTRKQSFSMEDAAKLGLSGRDNWKKQPKTMLNWRCIAAGMRLIAPDVVLGLYTPEEMNPSVEVIDAETGEVEIPEDSIKDAEVTKEDMADQAFGKLGNLPDSDKAILDEPIEKTAEASQKKPRTPTEHAEAIKAMESLFIEAFDEERWQDELIAASEFKNDKDEMVGAVTSLDEFKDYITRNGGMSKKKVKTRLMMICHKLEESWKEVEKASASTVKEGEEMWDKLEDEEQVCMIETPGDIAVKRGKSLFWLGTSNIKVPAFYILKGGGAAKTKSKNMTALPVHLIANDYLTHLHPPCSPQQHKSPPSGRTACWR